MTIARIIIHKRTVIEGKIAELRTKLKDLQDECGHPNAAHINNASTGNYDPSADSYWTDHKCPDCGKIWTTDQNWDK